MDTCHNTDDPWRHCAKWKTPDTKAAQKARISTIGKSIETEHRWVVGKGLGGRELGISNRNKGFGGERGDGNILELKLMNCTLQKGEFYGCELHLKKQV